MIEKQMSYFTKTERLVAEHIISKPQHVVNYTTKQLSAKSGTSEAAVIRFCKRIGINSFKDFKIELAKEISLEKHEILYDSPIQFEDTTDEVIDKVMKKSIKALQTTSQLLSTQQLDEAIQALYSAKRIYLYGAGGSSIVAQDLTLKLLRINTSAFHHADIHVQMMNAANMDERDVLFVVSTSGTTKEVLQLIDLAIAKNAKTILLTQQRKSQARSKADIILDISLEEENIRIGTMSARIAELAVVDALFIGLCIKMGDSVYNHIFSTHHVVSRIKK